MTARKRPMSPALVALITFLGVIVAGAIAGAFLVGSGPGSVARLERMGEGSAKLSIILAIVMYFVQRRRVTNSETTALREDPDRSREGPAAPRRRTHCGAAVVGSEKPWERKSYCSEKCLELS